VDAAVAAEGAQRRLRTAGHVVSDEDRLVGQNAVDDIRLGAGPERIAGRIEGLEKPEAFAVDEQCRPLEVQHHPRAVAVPGLLLRIRVTIDAAADTEGARVGDPHDLGAVTRQ
jgi:hypothetical protein